MANDASRRPSVSMTRLSAQLILLLFAVALGSHALAAGSFTTQQVAGRAYKIYVPSGYVPGQRVPLVVMLHGCTQDADKFARGTRMNDIAEQNTFIVAYPEQPAFSLLGLPPFVPGTGLTPNMGPNLPVVPMQGNVNKCWNWFMPEHQARGSGEPDIIRKIVTDVESDYAIDAKAIYVAGLSAGGAMAVLVGAAYPETFAAVGVGAGLEYKAATCAFPLNHCPPTGPFFVTTCFGGGVEAFTAMCQSGGPSPVQQGNAVFSSMGSNKRVVPVIVFHGTADDIVIPKNADQVVSQWAQTDDMAADGADNDNIDDVADETTPGQVPGAGGRKFTRHAYKDSASGAVVMETYLVEGMRHAWSGGDNTVDPYFDPKGPNASQLMWEFFKAHAKP
jgi:poly(hydroxyalkanoate) depolymerase family esterase